MSTAYRFCSDVRVDAVMQAADSLGLKVETREEETKTAFALTDGKVYLWFYHDGKENMINDMVRYGQNYDAREVILEPLADKLGVDFLDEYDEGYFDDTCDVDCGCHPDGDA